MENQNKSSNAIYHPKDCKMAIIREEYEAICKEAPNSCCAAVLLNVVEYWSGRPKTKEGGWIFRSYDDICKDIMKLFSTDTIGINMNWLVHSGYVYRRNNPEYKWDKKYQYLLNVKLVNNSISNWKSSTLQRKRKNRTSVDENHVNEHTGNQLAIQENKKESKKESSSTNVRKDVTFPVDGDVEAKHAAPSSTLANRELSDKQHEIAQWTYAILCAMDVEYLWDNDKSIHNSSLGRYFKTAKQLRDIAKKYMERYPHVTITPDILYKYFGKDGYKGGWIHKQFNNDVTPGLSAMVNHFDRYLRHWSKDIPRPAEVTRLSQNYNDDRFGTEEGFQKFYEKMMKNRKLGGKME